MFKAATLNKLLFYFQDVLKQLWFRCCLFCVFALAAFFIGPLLAAFIPDSVKEIVSKDALGNILEIMASSMLAVTIFSLSIMVQAFTTASTTATPRASKLLTEDRTAQNALGSFIGSFLFSIVGIIGISAGLYTSDILVVLFAFTLVMITLVVIMLLRWIHQLSRLGRVSVTIDLVEEALKTSIEDRGARPTLNAMKLELSEEELVERFHPVFSSEVGYVQYLDIEKLNSLALALGTHIYLNINPGNFTDSVRPIAFSERKLDYVLSSQISDAIVIGQDRTFSQDPRYGFVILSEIALRALSPGINDPGTAIDITHTYVRAIKLWLSSCGSAVVSVEKETSTCFDRVSVRPIEHADLLEDMFVLLVKEAAAHLTVVQHINKALSSIAHMGDKELARTVDYWKKRLAEQAKAKLSEMEFAKTGI